MVTFFKYINRYAVLLSVLVTLIFSASMMLLYMRNSLVGNIDFHIMSAEYFGVPEDLQKRGIEPLYKGKDIVGWDGQFYYYIANDLFAEKDTIEHIDGAKAYRYQRIGLPLTAKLISLALFQGWVSPTIYYFTSLVAILLATFFAARFFEQNNINGFFILIWSLGFGVQVTILNGLPDGFADSMLIISLLCLYYKKYKLYIIPAILACLAREAYIIFPIVILFVQFLQNLFCVSNKSKNVNISICLVSYIKGLKYAPFLIPIIIFLSWQIFLKLKFGLFPSQYTSQGLVGAPFASAVDYFWQSINLNHELYSYSMKRCVYEAIGIFLFLYLVFYILCQSITKLYFAIKSQKLLQVNYISLGINLSFVILAILYFMFGRTVMMDATGYMKAGSLFFFAIIYLSIVNGRKIKLLNIVILIAISFFFTHFIFYKTKVRVNSNNAFFTNVHSASYVKEQPECLKEYNIKLIPQKITEIKNLTRLRRYEKILDVKVTNNSSEVLKPFKGNGSSNVSYKWINSKNPSKSFDGYRSYLPEPLAPGGEAKVQLYLKMPKKPGNYILRLTMVQEGCGWFDNKNQASKFDIPYQIQ